MGKNRIINQENEKWLILAMCCLVASASIGTANAKSVFITPVCEDLGLTRAQYSVIFTINTAANSLMTLFMPQIFAKLGARKTILIGSIAQAAAYMVASFAPGLFTLYAAEVIKGLGYSLFNVSMLFLIINQWFTKRHGLASSIMTSFTGLGGALFSPLFSAVIQKAGWRNAERSVAAVTMLLCLPILLTRMNLTPPGEENSGADGEKKEAGISTRKADLADLILLCGLYALLSYAISMVQYISGYAETKGMDAAGSALILSMVMIGNVSSKLLFGPVSDIFGAGKTLIVMLGVNIAAAVMLTLSGGPVMMYAAALCFGSIYSVGGLGINLYTRQLFGNEGYIYCHPKMTVCYSVVHALVSPLIGGMYDSTGNYDLAMKLVVPVDMICIAAGLLLAAKQKKANNSAA